MDMRARFVLYDVNSVATFAAPAASRFLHHEAVLTRCRRFFTHRLYVLRVL